jgi:hypothetical protein
MDLAAGGPAMGTAWKGNALDQGSAPSLERRRIIGKGTEQEPKRALKAFPQNGMVVRATPKFIITFLPKCDDAVWVIATLFCGEVNLRRFRMLKPIYKAARELGVGINFLYLAVQEDVLPADAVIRVGRRKILIDLTRRDDIVRALAIWSHQRAGRLNGDREARIRRIVGGGE